MQPILIFLLLHFASFSILANDHLSELNSAFPQALLTDDFGILTKDDLQINSCIAHPTRFAEENSGSFYPHWQCFETKKARMLCEGRKYDTERKSRVSLLVLSGIRDGETHEFISRRTMELDSCRLYQKDWKRLTKDEKYVCISGADFTKENSGKKAIWTWIFGRYKTRKGCNSYFEGECTKANACAL